MHDGTIPGYNYPDCSITYRATRSRAMCRRLSSSTPAEYPTEAYITQSAVDLSNIGDVAAAASDLARSARRMRKLARSSGRRQIAFARLRVERTPDYYSRDSDRLRQSMRVRDRGQRATVYASLQTALSQAVISSTRTADLPAAMDWRSMSRLLMAIHHNMGSYRFRATRGWDDWLQASCNR